MTTPSSPPPGTLDRLPGHRVWVVGDVMLDEYVTGSVERISPEAPVPVLRAHNSEFRVGGAANVARQVATLGARVTLGGVVGADEAGHELLALLQRCDVDTRAVMVTETRRTTRKCRVLSQGQQLLRLDWEEATSVSEEITSQLMGRLEASPPPDIIVLSDYAKGVVNGRLIGGLTDLAKSANCRVLVDPKRPDFEHYRGAQILTPNLTELRKAAPRSFNPDSLGEIASVARELAEGHGFEALVVTLGERGLLAVPLHGPYEYIPASRRPVFDVTGAGDTVVGVLTAALSAGVSLVHSAFLANAAAGIAVGEVGTAAVTREQISHALAGSPSLKVLDRATLAGRLATWRLAGKRIVFTNGCFDLLHAGHLSLLQEASRQGDVLILAINSDDSVRRLKGAGRPLIPATDRAALLAALECVDAVTIFPEDTPLETIALVRPQTLVKGEDYRLEDVVGRKLVEDEGGKVVLVAFHDEHSTTEIVERIRRTSALAICQSQ
jgi:D-beta-D-heptose 7-phosphate kinase/D-beta-D-heptose 1-phosphate adenosyltransferase